MQNENYVVRCQMCGHTMEVDSIDDLICKDCHYDQFDIIVDNTHDDPDFYIEPESEKPKNCILYLVTKSGDTMVVMNNKKIQYSEIDRIDPDMRLYTYNGAHAAKDAILKKHPNWNLKVKQFK